MLSTYFVFNKLVSYTKSLEIFFFKVNFELSMRDTEKWNVFSKKFSDNLKKKNIFENKKKKLKKKKNYTQENDLDFKKKNNLKKNEKRVIDLRFGPVDWASMKEYNSKPFIDSKNDYRKYKYKPTDEEYKLLVNKAFGSKVKKEEKVIVKTYLGMDNKFKVKKFLLNWTFSDKKLFTKNYTSSFKNLKFFINRTRLFSLLSKSLPWGQLLLSFAEYWILTFLEFHDWLGLFIWGWTFFSWHVWFYFKQTYFDIGFNDIITDLPTNEFFYLLSKTIYKKKSIKKISLLFGLMKKYRLSNSSVIGRKLFDNFYEPFFTTFFEKTDTIHWQFFLRHFYTYWWLLSRWRPFNKNKFISPIRLSDWFLYRYPQMTNNYVFWYILRRFKKKRFEFLKLHLFSNKFFLKKFLVTISNLMIDKVKSIIFTNWTDTYFHLISTYFHFLKNLLFAENNDWFKKLFKILSPNFLDLNKLKLTSTYDEWLNEKLFRLIYSLNWSTAKTYFWYFFDWKVNTAPKYLYATDQKRFNLPIEYGHPRSLRKFDNLWEKFLYDNNNFNFTRLLREYFPKQCYSDATLWKIAKVGYWITFYNLKSMQKVLPHLYKKIIFYSKLSKFIFKKKNLDTNLFLRKKKIIFLLNDLKTTQFFYGWPYSSFTDFYNETSTISLTTKESLKGDFFLPLYFILHANIFIEPFSITSLQNRDWINAILDRPADWNDYKKFSSFFTFIGSKNLIWPEWSKITFLLESSFHIAKEKLKFLRKISLINFKENFFFPLSFSLSNFSFFFFKKISFFFTFIFYLRLIKPKSLFPALSFLFSLKNFSFVERKYWENMFDEYWKTSFFQWIIPHSTLWIKKESTLIYYRYVGSKVQRRHGSLVGFNYHFNVLIAPTFQRLTISRWNVYILPAYLLKRAHVKRKNLIPFKYLSNSIFDYFLLKLEFTNNLNFFVNGFWLNKWYTSMFNWRNFSFLKWKLINLKRKERIISKWKWYYFQYWLTHLSIFDKFTASELTSKMRRFNSKGSFYVLPFLILLDRWNPKLLKKYVTSIFDFSSFFDCLAAYELDNMKFSNFVFLFKTSPKKYFLGDVSLSLNKRSNNNFFFF